LDQVVGKGIVVVDYEDHIIFTAPGSFKAIIAGFWILDFGFWIHEHALLLLSKNPKNGVDSRFRGNDRTSQLQNRDKTAESSFANPKSKI
jgi:hypothetical protein